MKTLKKFLKTNRACKDGFNFAKDLTLEQFLNTCERGDWIIWLFHKMNPESLRELALAKAHCANTVRHLMKDLRSINAVDVAIRYGNGEATDKDLKAAVANAKAVTTVYTGVVDYCAATAAAANAAGHAASAAANTAGYAAGYINFVTAQKANQKMTADICRKHLPLSIWNQSKL